MLRIRLLDGRMLNLQRQGRIGFFGQCTGQEAAIVGSAAALEARDWVAPALREAGVALWRGLPIERLIAQCMGKGSEVSQGRQMPCHHSFRAANFVSMSSVIATQLLHAVGIARAAQLSKDPIVAMGYLGDGATSEHDFHCALNFAGVWKAPVVFFCQNNQWAISVPFAKQTAAKSIAAKAVAYGMPGVRVDGNDVLAVLDVTRQAVERARSGGGPTLIEALTYRRLGHSSSDDPTRYREQGEVAQWEAQDPIERLKRHLLALGLLTAAKDEAIEEELQAAISEGIRIAEQGGEPPLESLFTDVFAELTPQLREQQAAAQAELAARGGPLPSHHGSR
ncbi:MAG: 3-methyl-2-oxobutanoate dehydrogenase [Planctomycetes bacterium]|nr:3-methyl-2-oxobutanoate dehydrogenase [Planctomycetota bacterium]